MSRRAVAAASALVLAAGGAAIAATVASASQSTSASCGAMSAPYRHGLVPAKQCAVTVSSLYQNDLKNGGNIDGIGVTTGHEQVYLVFWGSQWGTASTNSSHDTVFSNDPVGAAPYLQEFFKGLGTSGDHWSGVLTQYCQGVHVGSTFCPATNTHHVAYPWGGALAGVWQDNASAEPYQPSGHDIGAEAVRAAAHFGNTTAFANRNANYVIISSTQMNPDNWLNSEFCAWHDYNGDTTLDGGPVSSPYGDIAFTNLPYQTDVGQSCGENFVNEGSAGTLDGWSIVEGHEYAETSTDQNPPGGWVTNTGPTGEENGDLCAWITPGTLGGSFNLTDQTGSYAVQTTWANDAHRAWPGGCEGSHPIVQNP